MGTAKRPKIKTETFKEVVAMDNKQLLKFVKLFYLFFNLSGAFSIVSIYFQVFPNQTKLYNLFQPLSSNNVMVPGMPLILLILAISLFLFCSRYFYKLIVYRIMSHS